MALEDEVAVFDGEDGALAVTGSALDTGGVSEDTLSHARAVDPSLLRRVRGVQVELAGLCEAEGGVVYVLGAGSVLLRGIDEEAGVGGLQRAVLEVGTGADGHDGEDITGLDVCVGSGCAGRGGDEGSSRGSDDGGGELHLDGVGEV